MAAQHGTFSSVRSGWHRLAAPLAMAAWLSACGMAVQNPHLHPTDRVPAVVKGSNVLKVHAKTGDLYLLKEWRLTEGGMRLEGIGTRYSVNRDPVGGEQAQSIPLADTALLETNDRSAAYPFAAQSLAVLTTFWGTVTGVCVADPKSCFGSCPTFYDDAGSLQAPVAEGFSASIARVLEERDVDALWSVRPREGRVVLRMRNEALETHAVRTVRLLVAPRPPGGRVLATAEGRYYEATALREPWSCRGPEGDCLGAVRAVDGLERASEADAVDLSARETLELEFPAAQGTSGLVLGARQSLLTTFLFYQTMAYAGAGGGDLLARLESTGREGAERALGMARVLGGIEAEVAEPDGIWRAIGSFREAGPIAGDIQVLPFEPPSDGGPLRVRLTLAKGDWRLGFVALARLGAQVEPRPLEARRVEPVGRPGADARAALLDPDRYLVTLPGDEYRLTFDLPRPLVESELFLESQGYYYEWQRAEWLKEEDPEMLRLVLARPDEALRRLAGPFKQREAQMQGSFWQSRFGR
jgi:hypothetical protein